MENCIFCKIINKEAPGVVVGENENCVAIENIHPVASVHLLIMPKTHIETFMDLEDTAILADMTKLAQELVSQKNINGAYKLVFNGGKYQAVPHVHWHLLGGEMEDKKDIINQT